MNKVNISYESYPKPRKINVFKQKIRSGYYYCHQAKITRCLTFFTKQFKEISFFTLQAAIKLLSSVWNLKKKILISSTLFTKQYKDISFFTLQEAMNLISIWNLKKNRNIIYSCVQWTNSLTSHSNSLTSQSIEPVDDISPRLQVCIGKLVELGPPLRNVGPPLLQDGVRPGEHEEGLGLADDVALRQLLGAPGV